MPIMRFPIKKKSKKVTFAIDNDNDKKELDNVIENKPANNNLIQKIKSLAVKNKKKKFVNLDL